MIKPITLWDKPIFFGKRKHDNVTITLEAPSWSCDWYWSYGGLDSKYDFYHLKYWETPHWYDKPQNRNMYHALQEDYVLAPEIQENLWLFCEFTETIYSFITIAAVYKRGGSYYTHSKDEQAITQDLIAYERINTVILPQLFDKLYTTITND